MAEGKIKQQSNTFLHGYGSKTVPYRTETVVSTISVPAGTWLLISHMVLSVSGNGVYSHSIGGRTVRSPENNGGGSVLARVEAGPISYDVKCWHNITNGCTAENVWHAIKLL